MPSHFIKKVQRSLMSLKNTINKSHNKRIFKIEYYTCLQDCKPDKDDRVKHKEKKLEK